MLQSFAMSWGTGSLHLSCSSRECGKPNALLSGKCLSLPLKTVFESITNWGFFTIQNQACCERRRLAISWPGRRLSWHISNLRKPFANRVAETPESWLRKTGDPRHQTSRVCRVPLPEPWHAMAHLDKHLSSSVLPKSKALLLRPEQPVPQGLWPTNFRPLVQSHLQNSWRPQLLSQQTPTAKSLSWRPSWDSIGIARWSATFWKQRWKRHIFHNFHQFAVSIPHLFVV